MFKCKDCERVFDEPNEVSEDAFYGIHCDFGYSTGEKVRICPYCESNDFREYDEEEYE